MLRTRSPRKEKISNCYLHSNSLSNKMDNSLLAVRDINHKYIVVGERVDEEKMVSRSDDWYNNSYRQLDGISAVWSGYGRLQFSCDII